MPKLVTKIFCLGDWMTNCYVFHRDGSSSCWIVDAGFEPQPLIQYIREHDLQPQQILMTHAHVDHIAGLQAIRAVWPDLPILIHEDEQDFLTEPALNLSGALPDPIIAPSASGTLSHGQILDLDSLRFELRHTPGHSPGGMTIYNASDQIAFVGDALFSGSIGRTDFPTADHDQLLDSIQNQLLTLPDQTRVLSGHGPETTIGHERATNPWL